MRSLWQDDYGDDPVTRTTSAPSPHGTVRVSHSLPPPPPYSVIRSRTAANAPPPPSPSTIAPEQPVRLVSQDSGMAPFETLYHDLEFEALPFYNFWERDEETTVRDRGNLSSDELPRFVKLAWRPAQDLKDPDEFQKRRLMGQMPDAHDQFTQLSPFGFGSHAVVGTNVEGMNFIPEHLQPSHFQQNAQQIANGYLFTGVVEAVVSVNTGTVAIPPRPSSDLIDEDEYLSQHSVFWGIPFSVINAALWRWRSSVYGTQQSVLGQTISNALSLQKQHLFDGQFGLKPPTGGDLSISAQNPSSPSISVFSKAIAGDRTYPTSRVLELVQPLNYVSNADADIYHDVRAKLIHTNFAGTVDQARVNTISQPHHAEAVIALAPLAGNMAVYSAAGAQHVSHEISIPSFNAPNTLKALEYIGYVIEKYELQDGSYALVDTLYIPGREYSSYLDAKVKYGVSYRYRIRSILRWSRPHGVGVLGTDPTVIETPGSHINAMAPNDVSYFGSEWNDSWAYATLVDRRPPNPPDEFVVRPHSVGEALPDGSQVLPFIEVTMKLPDNPQMDINRMVIYRKLQDQDGVDLTGWVQIQEINAVERQGTRHLLVAKWDHQQDDATGTKFDVHEEERVETFVEFAPENCRYRDFNVGFFGKDNSYRYVYAGVCYSRHGEESVLSDQLGARLNPDWKKSGELPVDFVSCAGVNMHFDTGIFGTYPERRTRSEVIFKPDPKKQTPGAIGLRAQERMAQKLLSNANYVMRVESLDCGQHFDIPVTMTVINQPEVVVQLPYRPLVSIAG